MTTDAGSNTIKLLRNGSDVDFCKNEPTTATPTLVVPYSDLGLVTITGGGATNITLDYSGGDLVPSGLNFNGASTAIASNQLTVTGASGTSYNLGGSSLSIAGTADTSAFSDAVNFSSLSAFNLTGSGGTSNIEISSGASPTFYTDLGASGTTVNVTVDSGASVYFGSTRHLGSLNISSGGFAQMLATGENIPANGAGPYTTGGELLDTNTLSVNGILDTTDCDMIVNDPTNSAMETLQDQVGYGVNDDPGTQGTIISSTANGDNMAIGVAPESVVGLGNLDGAAIPSTALDFRYTQYGDAYLEGGVYNDSLGLVGTNYTLANDGGTFPYWWQGDFYYEGNVYNDDLGIVATNYTLDYGQVGDATDTANVGTPVSIALPSTESSIGTVSRTDVNWGDGDFNSYPAGATTAWHTYTATASLAIQLTAVAADGAVYHPPTIPLIVSAAGVTATPVSFTASASTDVYVIAADGDGNTIITKNGTTIEDEATANILALSITGGAAEVSINFTNGDPLPVGGIYSDAAIITLDGPHSTDQLVTTSTAAYIGSDEIRFAPTTTLTDNLTSDGGIIAINGTTNLDNPAGDSLEVAPGATVLLNGSQTFSSLTIDAGATVRQISQDTTFGASVITVGTLYLSGPDSSGNGGGVLDLGNGDLIVRGASDSGIYALLEAGYDNGFWDGIAAAGPNQAAIISSAAANDPSSITTLGYAQIGTGEGDLAADDYDGESVYPGDVVVALTYSGDTNLDRQIDDTDYTSLNNGSADGLSGWVNGDFNYDGAIDGQDYQYQSYSTSLLYGSTPFAAASQPAVAIHLNNNLSDVVVIPTGAGSNAEQSGPIQVTATSGNQAAAVPKWTVHVTQNGKAVAPGWFYFVEKHSEGTTNNNEFTVYASSKVTPGDYTVTVDGPDGQTQVMTLTATATPPQ